MFSQHPDNAKKPYWHNESYLATHHEIEEAFLMFKDMGAQEVMWDWEGKFVDESVIERFLGNYPDFFQENPIGKDIFVTFRVPNPRVESGYRLGRAFMAILSAQHATHGSGFHSPPLFEVILPMTESATEILSTQDSFMRLFRAAKKSFGPNGVTKKGIEVIPIFESVDTILRSADILKEYLQSSKVKPAYLRPFCARSDPALNSGIVPTTLAIKWALSEYHKLAISSGTTMYPIIAPGSLPFRGGLTPRSAKKFMAEFPGIKTLVIQSAFRYDYPISLVKKMVRHISDTMASLSTEVLPDDVINELNTIIPWFEAPYQQSVEEIAPLIGQISVHIPKRRERVQHIGLFGYSRQMGKTKLPRAIGFVASCYSLGIPPELMGTGSGLRQARKTGKLKLVERLYKELKPTFVKAGRYLRKDSLEELGLKHISQEVKYIEDYLGVELGPKTKSQHLHHDLSSAIISSLRNGQSPSQDIEKAAILRKSIG